MLNKEEFMKYAKYTITDYVSDDVKKLTPSIAFCDTDGREENVLRFSDAKGIACEVSMDHVYEHYSGGLDVDTVVEKLGEAISREYFPNKMDFPEFAMYVCNHVVQYLPDGMKDMEPKIIHADDCNMSLGLAFNDPKTHVHSPILVLDAAYTTYIREKDIDKAMESLRDRVENTIYDMIQVISQMNKENIFLHLVNKEKYESVLETIPHKDFLDLTIIYRILVTTEDKMMNVLVRNDMLPSIGISEDEIYDWAYQNTIRLFPMENKTMAEKMIEMYASIGIPRSIAISLIEEFSQVPMNILSNAEGILGATAMLYPELLKKISQKYGGSDLALFPCSIHEIIAVPIDDNPPVDDLKRMVEQCNVEAVSDEDFLSNSVYIYSPENGVSIME